MEDGVMVFKYDELLLSSLAEFASRGLVAVCDGDSETVTVGTEDELLQESLEVF